MIKNIINSAKKQKNVSQTTEPASVGITCDSSIGSNNCDRARQRQSTMENLPAKTAVAINGAYLFAAKSDTMSNASGKSQISSGSSRFKLSRKNKKRLSAMMGRLHLRRNRSSPGGLTLEDGYKKHNGSIDSESVHTDDSHDDNDSFYQNHRTSNDFRPTVTTTTTTTDEDNSDSEYELASDELFEDALAVEAMRQKEIAHEQAAKTPAHNDYKPTKDNQLLPEEECDIPTFLHTKPCDPALIEQTRILLKERYLKNPDSFYEADYQRMLTDDWTVSRFLLRRRLDPKRTAKLMEECGRFRIQYKMSEVQLWEFPREFHRAGGLFKYAPDRVGNYTLYMRVKMYRRVPEISDVFKAFILCVLEECDRANNGRGTAIIFDLTGCGLQNVDLGFLSWLLSSFRNYCPKGVSYILVYNLPWILNATCKMAMTWMSASNRRALRFVHGDEIENFIARENLPDYLGGTCKIDYKAVPEGSKPATEVCDRLDMTREQALKIRDLFKEYLQDEDLVGDTTATGRSESYNDCTKSVPTNSKSHLPMRSADDSTSGKYLSLDDIREDTVDAFDDGIANSTAATTAELVSRASKFIA